MLSRLFIGARFLTLVVGHGQSIGELVSASPVIKKVVIQKVSSIFVRYNMQNTCASTVGEKNSELKLKENELCLDLNFSKWKDPLAILDIKDKLGKYLLPSLFHPSLSKKKCFFPCLV
jgi:hypothetical protein